MGGGFRDAGMETGVGRGAIPHPRDDLFVLRIMNHSLGRGSGCLVEQNKVAF